METENATISPTNDNITNDTNPQKTNAADHFSVKMKKKLRAAAITIAYKKLGISESNIWGISNSISTISTPSEFLREDGREIHAPNTSIREALILRQMMENYTYVRMCFRTNPNKYWPALHFSIGRSY